jgi:hypothetical protein
MEGLVFCQLEGRRSNMCRLSIHHNRNSLCGGDMKLEGGQVSLFPMKKMYIGALVGVGMGQMSKSPTVKASPFQNPLLVFLRY